MLGRTWDGLCELIRASQRGADAVVEKKALAGSFHVEP